MSALKRFLFFNRFYFGLYKSVPRTTVHLIEILRHKQNITSKQYPTSSAETDNTIKSFGNKQKYRSLLPTSSFSRKTCPMCTK